MKFLHALMSVGLACLFVAPAVMVRAQQGAPGRATPNISLNFTAIRRTALPRLTNARQAVNQAAEALSFSFGVVQNQNPQQAVQSLTRAQNLLQRALQKVQAAREACASGQHIRQ